MVNTVKNEVAAEKSDYQLECEAFALYGSHAEEHAEFERGSEDMELRAMRMEAEEMSRLEWEREMSLPFDVEPDRDPVSYVEPVYVPRVYDPNDILF